MERKKEAGINDPLYTSLRVITVACRLLGAGNFGYYRTEPARASL